MKTYTIKDILISETSDVLTMSLPMAVVISGILRETIIVDLLFEHLMTQIEAPEAAKAAQSLKQSREAREILLKRLDEVIDRFVD